MIETLLTLNAGSSSVKFCLFEFREDLRLLGHGKVTDIGGAPILTAVHDEANETITTSLAKRASQEDALRAIFDWIQNHRSNWHIKAIAHRIVHGGVRFLGPVRVTADIFHELKKLCPLAPLHQPHNLAAVGITGQLLAHVPQIACFDTAFHAHHDPLFSFYALSQDWAEKGVRRYGFHGLSYEWISNVLKFQHPDLAKARVVAAHLGNGASLCAMVEGKSVDTTMGMTALDGLPMGTRSGAIDPGALIYMMRDLKMSPDQVERILYEEAGLKGMSGLTNNVKDLLASQDPRAKFSLDYFILKTAQYMAMMAAAIGGIDVLVFTGGIGENAASVREKILECLAFLGRPEVLVIPANEERMMAIHALEYVKQDRM